MPYVAEHAGHLAAGVEHVEGIQREVQGVGIEGAEAFVEEQRVGRGLVADQEAFAAG